MKTKLKYTKSGKCIPTDIHKHQRNQLSESSTTGAKDRYHRQVRTPAA